MDVEGYSLKVKEETLRQIAEEIVEELKEELKKLRGEEEFREFIESYVRDLWSLPEAHPSFRLRAVVYNINEFGAEIIVAEAEYVIEIYIAIDYGVSVHVSRIEPVISLSHPPDYDPF